MGAGDDRELSAGDDTGEDEWDENAAEKASDGPSDGEEEGVETDGARKSKKKAKGAKRRRISKEGADSGGKKRAPRWTKAVRAEALRVSHTRIVLVFALVMSDRR